MFEFAISKNQKQRPTRRVFTSWIISCIVHLCLIFLLIQYPQMLRGGMYHRFQPFRMIANLLGAQSGHDEENWRTVTVLRSPMTAPSGDALRKLLPDWDKKDAAPPITLRWGDEEKPPKPDAAPVPRIEPEPKQRDAMRLPPPSEVASGGSGGDSPESAPGTSSAAQAEPAAARKGTANLPPPEPAPQTAGNNPPKTIPDGIKPPSPVTPSDIKVFENEQKAIHSRESGFFDTNGFPLGEYANIIKERIKGNWFIPSNLKNSQGHTTIVFYIGKDGRYTDARIEPSASSGNTSLNLAALKAIMDSSPFPPLPKGFPGEHIGAKFVLSYNEPFESQ